MAKAKKVLWQEREDGVVAVFPDGTRQEFSLALLPEEIWQRLVCYGLKQKLSDSVAGVADPAKKRAGMLQMYETLKQGLWEKPRTNTTATIEELRKTKDLLEQVRRLIAEGKADEAQQLLSQI